MNYTFQQSKDIVLMATYEALLLDADYETFGADLVHSRLPPPFSLGFIRRILTTLAEDRLINVDHQYEESSPPHYTVSDAGFEKLEKLAPLEQLLLGEQKSEQIDEIPASDRLVTLTHNQQSQFEVPLSEVLQLVEAENSIDGEEGLRELTLGRLRAGQELIRAGIFSLRSMQLTLIVGLRLLAEKYRETTIGICAAKLLDLLLQQYGIG